MTQPIQQTTDPRVSTGRSSIAALDSLVALEAEHIFKTYRRGWRKAENAVIWIVGLAVVTTTVFRRIAELKETQN